MNSKYFDNAATTRVKEEVLKEMIPYYLKGIAWKYKEKGKHIITSKIEHHAILNSCKALEKDGFKITYLNVDEYGLIDLEELKNEITTDTILISIMFANNEIGTIQPIKEISKIAKQNNILFHVDAVQACGNIPIDVKDYKIDLLSLSGHKLYGPKGTGALYVRNEIELENIIDGGHQEKGKRAGTENVAGIVGLGTACRIAKENLYTHMKYLKKLRDYYILEIERRIANVKLNGAKEERLPGNANFSFENVDGSVILLKLDQLGISASSGSACSTGDSKPSHVLTAIGLDTDTAKSTLRITFGEDNTIEDVDYLINSLDKIVKELRNSNEEITS